MSDQTTEQDLDDDQSGVDPTIERNEDGEVTGFAGDPDLVPEHVHDNPGALVTGRNDFEFETPVWGHADTFMEMEEAGILVLAEEKSVQFGDHIVWIYKTAGGR